jgi:beta-phosphoglucomutase-like phosphatase (HAD superfamily)
VLFDLDGILIDSVYHHVHAWLSPKARNDARYSQRGKEGIVSIEQDLEETDREARPLKQY